MSRYIDAERIDWRLIIPTNVTIAEENMIHLAKKLVEQQPIADVVEVVHGEWIKITDVDIRLMGRQIKEVHYKCSVCGGEYYFDTNYCPHCGADMRERREDGKIH